jgi:DNA-binding response OmpR family regulator
MRHILIVDDALDLGRLLKTALSLIDSTMPIVVVPSGEEALLEGSRYPLDLLITDIRLPGISGVELVQKIRKYHPDVRIIMITGLNDEQVRRDVKELGVDYFFTKPLSMQEFTDAARRCLQPDSGITNGKVVQSVPETSQQLSDVISGLRSRLDAVAVALLNESARIEVEAGSVPEILGEEAFTRLLTVMHASRMLPRIHKDSGPEITLTYRGETLDLIATPIGHFVLIVVLQASVSNLRLAFCLEEMMLAHAALKCNLEHMGMAPSAVEQNGFDDQEQMETQLPENVVGEAASDPALEAFESIFVAANLEDVDSFWEKASSESGDVDAVDPEVLTYEQAHKLGLTPDRDSLDD